MLLTVDKSRNVAILVYGKINKDHWHSYIVDLDYDTPFTKRMDISFLFA